MLNLKSAKFDGWQACKLAVILWMMLIIWKKC